MRSTLPVTRLSRWSDLTSGVNRIETGTARPGAVASAFCQGVVTMKSRLPLSALWPCPRQETGIGNAGARKRWRGHVARCQSGLRQIATIGWRSPARWTGWKAKSLVEMRIVFRRVEWMRCSPVCCQRHLASAFVHSDALSRGRGCVGEAGAIRLRVRSLALTNDASSLMEEDGRELSRAAVMFRDGHSLPRIVAGTTQGIVWNVQSLPYRSLM